MFYQRMLSVAVIFGIGVCAAFAQAADQQVMLMLGGASCDTHTNEVKTALQAVKGVKSVDATSMPGHTVVLAEAGSVTPEHLTATVGRVKGTNWHCTAEVMK